LKQSSLFATVLWSFVCAAACGGADGGWEGKTFLLDVPATNWAEPQGIGGDIGDFVPQFLIGVEKGTGADDLAITIGTAVGGTQDPCNRTAQTTASKANHPKVAIGAATFPLHIVDTNQTPPVVVDATIHDLAFKDVLPGGARADGEVAATIDATEVYPLFRLIPNPSPDEVCKALAQVGAPCITCAHSGQTYCLRIKAVQLGTTPSARVKAISASDIPASCSSP